MAAFKRVVFPATGRFAVDSRTDGHSHATVPNAVATLPPTTIGNQ
jgi:hypothetical protein